MAAPRCTGPASTASSAILNAASCLALPLPPGQGITEVLLAAGAELEATDECGNTALHLAIQYDLGEVVAALVGAGADTTAKDRGPQPVHSSSPLPPSAIRFCACTTA
ncbi:hypothetical protein TSOC_009796 [Tetrabaena socialis]|uniref:Uncharacterized protein n=1 Tax=Tetrabaena socialis TaxID=47790 RepID=A0A2J7ZUY1_9CHLO|nr:hypothetical protein TSOC_009796 [Tetrabaena socialis]|eukprot:PNH04081.1 hypothetical protein TSOC_009796 [Tetrabaena socialis]